MSHFHYTCAASTLRSGTTVNGIQFDTVVTDPDSTYNATHDCFEVPSGWNGKYGQLNVTHCWASNELQSVVYIQKSTNGGSTWDSVSRSSLPQFNQHNSFLSPILLFSTGDLYRAAIYSNTTYQTLAASYLVNFTGCLLQDVDNTVNFFKYSLSANATPTAGVWSPLVYDTTDYESYTSPMLSSGQIVIPGGYPDSMLFITASSVVNDGDGSGYHRLHIERSATVIYGAGASGSNQPEYNTSLLFPVQAGDVIYMEVWNSASETYKGGPLGTDTHIRGFLMERV